MEEWREGKGKRVRHSKSKESNSSAHLVEHILGERDEVLVGVRRELFGRAWGVGVVEAVQEVPELEFFLVDVVDNLC